MSVSSASIPLFRLQYWLAARSVERLIQSVKYTNIDIWGHCLFRSVRSWPFILSNDGSKLKFQSTVYLQTQQDAENIQLNNQPD
jgi:hypothetical protein